MSNSTVDLLKKTEDEIILEIKHILELLKVASNLAKD